MALTSKDWTPALQERFLAVLGETGNVRRAAAAVRRSPTTCYARRKLDPAFADAWDATLQAAMDTVLEPEAIRRAVQGVERPVWHQGQQIGTVREYSDTLLIFLMKGWNPDRYKDRREVFHKGTLTLLQKMEQIAQMSPEELAAFLQDVEAYTNGLTQEGRG